MAKIKASIIILSLIMIGCKDKKEEDVDCYPKTVYVDSRGNKATKCGCVDNTATSSYWMLTNEYMVDKFDYAKELQPYKGMGLCSECGRLATSPDGRDVVVPGKWHGKFPKEKATEEQLKKVGYKNLIK